MAITDGILSKLDEQEIVAAITEAELNTSGEIRVHIESGYDKPVLERAKEVFELLKMDQTASKNGVLFYIAIKQKNFAIIGDEGIDKIVKHNFWDSIKDTMVKHFKMGEFKIGLIKGIIETGNKLHTHFPFQKDDTNELPNEISKGE